MNLEQTITRQIDHCIDNYGDNRNELRIKLVSLVLEWYLKVKSDLKIVEEVH